MEIGQEFVISILCVHLEAYNYDPETMFAYCLIQVDNLKPTIL